MNVRTLLAICAATASLAMVTAKASAALSPAEFVHPPADARPWVYAFWMEGNVTREGITADLEAMAREGVGGILFMDGALGNPSGPHRFMSASWREMFRHMLAEADRLGLKVNLNNAPGWAGSGGPWVKPEQATQKVIESETIVEGPARRTIDLPKPAGIAHGYYRDIAVLAYPVEVSDASGFFRIPDHASTKSFAGGEDFADVVPWPRQIPTHASWPSIPPEQLIRSKDMRDLAGRMDETGRLTWDVPAGRWLILRIGHTVANGVLRSAQPEANGLESDKLSKAAIKAQFEAMVGALADDIGPLTGRSLVSVHIDSWESGSGNWTDGFREEFRRRRGYDLLPFMPTLNGIVVDSLEVSERFLWDLRETISEMLLENYAGYMRELARERGLQLSIEAYDGTSDDLRYAGRADQPMSEFWQRPLYNGLPMCDLSEEMVSAAHVYGKPIVGAEAFTARWGDFLDHPGTLKPLADWAFCTGVNRLYFSEWVMQPWPTVAPGVSFRDLGTVFGANLTWWPFSHAWHRYIARAQYVLRQGRFVADVCYMTPEGAPGRFIAPLPISERGGIPRRPGYNYDACPPEVVLKDMSVEGDQVTLPSGMKYRVLVLPTYDALGQPVLQLMPGRDYYYKPMPLPKVQTMTPQLLRRVKALLEAGATVVGTRPLASPSLVNYPDCDQELEQLADEIWGKGEGASGSGQRKMGKGTIIWGKTPEQVLAARGVPPDFSADEPLRDKLNYTHRRLEDGTDIYFIANEQDAPVEGTVHFRTTGRRPEWWWPRTGDIQAAAVYKERDRVTDMPISLNTHESAFVVFRQPAQPHWTAVTSVEPAASASNAGSEPPAQGDDFIMAAWVQPGGLIPLPTQGPDGLAYPQGTLMAPGAGAQTFVSPGQGRAGFAVGANGIVVFQYGPKGEVQPLLVYAHSFAGPKGSGEAVAATSGDPLMAAVAPRRVHVGVVYKDRTPYLFLDGKLIATGPRSHFPPREGDAWDDHRVFAGDLAALKWFEERLRASGYGDLVRATPAQDAPAIDVSHGLLWRSGTYRLQASDGTQRKQKVDIAPPMQLRGPWQVEFDRPDGEPLKVSFSQLESWSAHPEDAIRYYSGAATYRKTFRLAFDTARSTRIYLDLGRVEVLADVTLNGKHLGVLWKAPYRIDVTDALHAQGENVLELRIVNLWVNRLIGDEHRPPDSQRNALGGVESWPKWLLEGRASPTGRQTFASWRVWTAEDPLIASGLLGPVRLIPAAEMAQLH